MPEHRRLAAAVVTVGAATALVGTFLTWVRSGEAGRSSYEILGLVERLGFASGGVVEWLLRLWPFVPLALVVATVAQWWHHDADTWHYARRAVAGVAVVYPAAIAIAVLRAPEIALFTVGVGPTITLAGAAVMFVGLVAEAFTGTTGRAPSARPSAPVDDPS